MKVFYSMVLLTSMCLSLASAQNRKQYAEEYHAISQWMGSALSKIMKQSSDGVIVSRFHQIQIVNENNRWTIRVNCIQKERDVYDAAGRFRGKISYYEPHADGFILRISRKHLDDLPNGKPKDFNRARRDDGVTELTGWVTSSAYPRFVCMIWGLEGQKFDDKMKALVDSLIADLELSIAKTEK